MIYPDDFAEREVPAFTVIPWLVWGAIVVALIGGLAYCSPAKAQPVVVHSLKQDGVSIRLMSGKCVDETSVMILMMNGPHFFDRAKSISSTWPTQDGKDQEYAGCWFELTKEEAQHSEPVMILIFADGQVLSVPKSAFTKQQGQVGV